MGPCVSLAVYLLVIVDTPSPFSLDSSLEIDPELGPDLEHRAAQSVTSSSLS